MPTPNNDAPQHIEHTEVHKEVHKSGTPGILIAALVLALAGNVFLLVRSVRQSDQIAQMKSDLQSELARLDTGVIAQRADFQGRIATVSASADTANEAAAAAYQRALADSQRRARELNKKLEQSQEQFAGELSSLKDETSSKITEVSTDVGNVKNDVTGVKTDVSGVKSEVQSAQSEIDRHGTDLKRMRGDMGVMSGLIATNSKDLSVLRELGERNYTEFKLSKKEPTAKVGEVTLTLKKADQKRNRYTVEVFADDKKFEKRDRTINEPVQVYVSGNRLPNEIVVNQVGKDEVVGYLATPKVLARR